MFEYYGVLSEDNHKEFNMACEELKVIFNDSSNGKYPADNSVIELITSLQSNVNSPCLSPEDRNNNKKNNTETNLDDLNSLQKVIRIILKGEWDKVKVESGDSYKKQRKVDPIQHKVDQKYALLCILPPTEKQRNTVIRGSVSPEKVFKSETEGFPRQ